MSSVARRWAGLWLGLVVVAHGLWAAQPRDDGALAVRWLQDSSRSLVLEQVVRDGRWLPVSGGSLAPGVSPAVFWLHATLDNPGSQARRVVLDLGTAQQDYVDWFVTSADGALLDSGQTGDRRPFHSRALPARALAVPVALPPGSTRHVYLRLDSQHGWFDVISPTLHDTDTWLMDSQRQDFALAAYLGGVVLLALLALGLYAPSRLPAAGWYVMYLLSLAGFVMGVYGLDLMHLWPDAPHWHNRWVLYAAQLAYLSGSLVIITHLRLRESVPRPVGWCLRALVLLCVANLLVITADVGVWAVWGTAAGALLTLACWLLAAWRWRQGSREAGPIAWGALAVLVGITFHYSALLGNGQAGALMGPLMLGSGVQMALMAYSVVVAALRWRRERQRAQLETRATQERLLREVNHAQRHDAVTGLPNPLALRDWLAGRLRNDAPLTLMRLRLYRPDSEVIARVSADTERWLQRVAQVCADLVGARGLAARWEGEHFVLALDGADRWQAECWARGLLVRLGALGASEGRLAQLGAAVYPDDGWDGETLLRRAEIALSSRAPAGEGLQWYQADLSAARERRSDLAIDLRQAVAQGQLSLVYQPQQDVREGHARDLEALMRWRHPTHGWVAPSEFLALAEAGGLMAELTAWALDTGLSQLARWNAAGERWCLSVNVSAHDLQDEGLVQRVLDGLQHHGVAADQLKIEVTESDLMKDPLQARRVMLALRAHGVAWSIDDFGTGHSSLATLRNLPFQQLKIDKSFLDGMDADGGDGDAARVVRTIIDLGHGLGMEVVAEGVEKVAQYNLLRRWGCDKLQGHLIARPLLADDLLEWAREFRADPGKNTPP